MARQGILVQHCVSHGFEDPVTATSVPPFRDILSPVCTCVLKDSTFLSTSYHRFTGIEYFNTAEMLYIVSVTMCSLWVVALSLGFTDPNQDHHGHHSHS